MTYKLYYAAESASMGIRLILEELGMPYELIQSTTDKDVQRPPEQVLINPNGWLPVLVWDEGAMYEAAAITIFLCDRHPEANLAPRFDDPQRGVYLQTLVYFSSTLFKTLFNSVTTLIGSQIRSKVNRVQNTEGSGAYVKHGQ